MSGNPALEIGSLIRCTLVGDGVVEGAVFAVDENNGMIVLMEVNRRAGGASSASAQQQQSFTNPNTHILNAKFIKKVEFIGDSTGGHLMPLPRNVVGQTLPVAENGDVKKLVAKLKNEQKKRTGMYHELASIDACDAFEYFFKLNPDLRWSVEPAHLDKATRAMYESTGEKQPAAADAEADPNATVRLVLALSGGNVLLSGNNDKAGHSWKCPKVIPLSESVSPDLVARITKMAEACQSKSS